MKKLGLIILVVIMALGALGAAYAAWSQPLYVNGNVQMGTLKAQFDQIHPNTPGDIASVTTTYLTYATVNDVMVVTVGNAYPGMDEIVYYKVWNSGTIPCKVTGVSTSGNPSWMTVTTTVPSDTIAPSADSTTWGSVEIKVDPATDNSVQGLSYSFQVVLSAGQ
jgi:hypothetical protein